MGLGAAGVEAAASGQITASDLASPVIANSRAANVAAGPAVVGIGEEIGAVARWWGCSWWDDDGYGLSGSAGCVYISGSREGVLFTQDGTAVLVGAILRQEQALAYWPVAVHGLA